MEENEKKLSEKQEKILEELCMCNGVSYEKLEEGSGMGVHKLEMFFSGYPEMVGLSYFQNLRTLCLMGQDTLERIEGLDQLIHLEELWICEANVQEISGLNNCQKLKRLYLYDNAISKINNLSHLSLLEVLWLNDNFICSIQGLDGLSRLKELNLSNNKICCIGPSLEKLTKLETLHLSGNQIRSLKDLNDLVQLRSLRTLSLKDPVYRANPVATMCNYATYVFYHLPGLKRLDSYDVDNESFKGLAEATVRKKKMYYNMRVKSLERSMSNLIKQVEVEKERLRDPLSMRIRKLMNVLKTLEREYETPSVNETLASSGEQDNRSTHESYRRQLGLKISCIKERVQELETACEEIDECFRESRDQVENISKATVQRLFLELETCGNVRFEDGTPNDVWYTSCHDLVLSRFCASDYKAYDITGIKMHRITRVHDRVLRVAFDEKVSAQVMKNSDLDATDQKNVIRNSIEYLFIVWNPILNSSDGFLRVLEGGCQELAGIETGGTHLSNNVFNSDCKRLEFLIKQCERKVQGDRCPYRHGQLIIAKVFVGDMRLARDGERSITRENFLGADSVFVQRSEGDDNKCEPRLSTELNEPSCDCHTKQGDWFVFDTDLILPEYVVDFEYLTKLKPVSPLICYYGDMSGNGESGSSDDKADPDSDVLDMKPFVQPKPRMIELTEELLLKYCSVESIKNITVLDLHSSGLVRLKNIKHLACLKTLVVSFNGLIKLDDISSMPNLSYLDASFNRLTTLEGLKGCPVLNYLDVSWNKLQQVREEIGFLRKHVTSLASLDTRHNPWLRSDNFRMYTIGRLRILQELDGKEITDQEHALALRKAASSRISSFTLLAHSRTDKDVVRSLSLASTAEIIVKHSKSKPLLLGEDDTKWMESVTTLVLDSQGISKLSNLEKLQHLRWASFNDNNINKVEGLDSCAMLEELSFSRNCISKIEGLAKLVNLKRLNLDDNSLSSLDGNVMEQLVSLEYLSIENNFISSVQGLKKSASLQELFAGNNLLSNTREVFFLKGLQNLDILDLSGNPVAKNNDNHRLFVIYHVSSLKALNGAAVTSAERSCAKDTLGGRMTTDFVAERLGHANFMDLQEIDLPHCDLRAIDVGNGEVFKNLRSINLEHNNLTSFGGLIHLANLKVLCLNYNKIECVFCKKKSASPTNKKASAPVNSNDVTVPQNFTPVLENLEVLHLGYNGISDLKALQLSRIPNLKALFLQGNEISKVEGLEGLQELRELVLDQNKIKTLSETSFIGQRKLQELHIEDNRLRNLSHLEPLFNIQRLYFGMNKIQDLTELQKLEKFTNLFEISLVSNPLTRRLMHRPILVYRQPNILCIDGIPVTTDERTKAEVYLIEHQLASVVNPDYVDSNLPNLQTKAQAPLKVTTVQLSASLDNGWNVGQRLAHVDFLNSISPTHSRYNDRNDVRGKLRGSNSFPSQNTSQMSSYDSSSLPLGRRQPPPSSVNLSKSQGHMSGTYFLRGNPNSAFPSPPKK